MAAVQHLRVFVRERLSAAAEEIFRVFEQTILQYEEELDRQHGQRDRQRDGQRDGPVSWTAHTADLPQPDVCKEERKVLAGQQQKGDSGQDQAKPPVQIKEEPEELYTSQEGEQLALKEESDTIMVTLSYDESDFSEADNEQLLSYSSPVAEGKDKRASASNAEVPQPEDLQKSNTSPGNSVDKSVACENQCKTDGGKKPVKCDVCGKTFKYNFQMKKHYRIHTGEKPYACGTCGKRFYQIYFMRYHERSHTGEKSHLCNTCGKRFTDLSAFKRHTSIHTGEKPYSCQTCGKNFRHSATLLVHMRTHTGEKPYLCNTCGKRFNNLSAVKKHSAIHTGEKPYSCKVCGKSFTQSGNLTAHMRTHTGEKWYSCETCGKSFSRSSNLNVHMRTHTGEKPYHCSVCGERFKYAATLKNHMGTHKTPHACESCGKGCGGSDTLPVPVGTNAGEKSES